MGAWIEILLITVTLNILSKSHPTMGAWIEISLSMIFLLDSRRRTPRWVRGLKLETGQKRQSQRWSHPTMGAWIEIASSFGVILGTLSSHPTMGAWIEIPLALAEFKTPAVAPHDGCVD